eukprot:924387-Pyramimonas_sp.AAC.1
MCHKQRWPSRHELQKTGKPKFANSPADWKKGAITPRSNTPPTPNETSDTTSTSMPDGLHRPKENCSGRKTAQNSKQTAQQSSPGYGNASRQRGDAHSTEYTQINGQIDNTPHPSCNAHR